MIPHRWSIPFRILEAFFRTLGRLTGSRLVLLALVVAPPAFGAGTTIPERYAGLCARIGQPEGCAPTLHPAGSAWVTVIIADQTTEPGAPANSSRAATIFIDSRKGKFAQVYQAPEVYGEYGSISACVTPECVELRPTVPNYTGPAEADVLSPVTIVNKAIWQHAETRLADALRTAYGQTGLPVLTDVRSVTIRDGSQTDAPTIVRFRGRFAFAD